MSNADRQRAYRERLRNAGVTETVTESPVTPPAVTVQGVTEEEYVARELAITRHMVMGRMIDGKPVDPGPALERSERYLRSRFQGVLSGEVASL